MMPEKDEVPKEKGKEKDLPAWLELVPEGKREKLAADIKTGRVLEKPKCKVCGWEGDKPALRGAGCPQCGATIG